MPLATKLTVSRNNSDRGPTFPLPTTLPWVRPLLRQASGTSAVANAAGVPSAAVSSKSTALLVALGDGLEGNSALQIWSDFVSSARKPVTSATITKQGNFDRECGGGSGGSVVSGSGREHDRRGIGIGEERWPDGEDASQSSFPPVWILTSDPEVDKKIREDMPNLLSLFVPGALGDDVGGTGGPKQPEHLSSWSDVLDRFLSENPAADTFGIFGEGAMPTAALLPYFVGPDSAGSSAPAVATPGCGSGGRSSGGGCAIETILWPVLSKATPPTAVISRARAWWVDGSVREGADAGLCGSEGRVGDWMPDRFVAQVRGPSQVARTDFVLLQGRTGSV